MKLKGRYKIDSTLISNLPFTTVLLKQYLSDFVQKRIISNYAIFYLDKENHKQCSIKSELLPNRFPHILAHLLDSKLLQHQVLLKLYRMSSL